MNKDLIAPCGINCGVCRAYLREKNKCPGCRNKPTFKSCQNCKIFLCDKRKGQFCDCESFPCERLKHLDKRYRTKYDASPIENLETIHKDGIKELLASEEKKWISDKGILCMHDRKYYKQ